MKQGPGHSASAAASAERQAAAVRVLGLLDQAYPAASTALQHVGPGQLLVAVMLSAQCTDVLVNRVTPTLFERFPSVPALAQASLEELEAILRPVNYYRTKSRHVQATCRLLVAEHQGRVPQTMEELVRLPGVGRKTANVVLGSAFGRAEGVVVDTHVGRLSRRLGWTTAANATGVERDLMRLLPRGAWIAASHRLILHGRLVCRARRPQCGGCLVASLCPTAPPVAPIRSKP